MKIFGTGPIRPAATRPTSRTKAKSGGAFKAHLAPAEQGVQAASGSLPISAVDSLLTLQEVPDAAAERRRALKRGEDLLDRLDEIRHGLLVGAIPVSRLQALAEMVEARKGTAIDPQLTDILQQIELRVKVELAKLSR